MEKEAAGGFYVTLASNAQRGSTLKIRYGILELN